MTVIDNICGLIDLSGSIVNGNFITREFGYVGMGRQFKDTKSSLFDFKPFMTDMVDLSRLSRHKKTKTRREIIVYNINDLDDHVVRFYDAVKTKRKDVLGYKGGHVEKDILEDLDIPSVNIEDMGCPRFDDLRCERFNRLACQYHRNQSLHCPKAEVAAFKEWLEENC